MITDIERILREHEERLRRVEREKLSRRIGLVTDDSPLMVEIAGEVLGPLEKIDCDPSIGDRVWVSRAGGRRSGADLVVHGVIGGSGGGGGSYSPPIPQSDVTDLPADLAAIAGDIAALEALAVVAAYVGVTNTFTLPQIIDLSATGTAWTLDVHTGGGEKWLQFNEGGAARGSIGEFLNLLVLTGEAGLGLSTVAGDVTLSPAGDVSVNSKRIKSVADATAATDALNRQTGDARYQPLDSDLTTLGALGSGARSALGLAIGTNVQAYDAELTDVANIEDEWVLVHDFGVNNLPLDASTTERAFAANTAQVQAAASFATGTAPNLWRANSANYPSFAGKTLKLRLRVWAAVNGTDPNADVDFKLKPITIGGGTDALTATFGAQAGSTAQVTNAALGTNEHEEAASASFNCPSADLYVCTVTLSATLANNSAMWVGAKLERRWE